MKLSEYKNELSKGGFSTVQQNEVIQIRFKDKPICAFNIKLSAMRLLPMNANVFYFMNAYQLYTFLVITKEFLDTPLDKRSLEIRYRLRLKGLDSDNGPQYLTTAGDKVFACAWRYGLKQSFTLAELENIRNRPQFKSVVWFDELMKSGLEEVDSDD